MMQDQKGPFAVSWSK